MSDQDEKPQDEEPASGADDREPSPEEEQAQEAGRQPDSPPDGE